MLSYVYSSAARNPPSYVTKSMINLTTFHVPADPYGSVSYIDIIDNINI